MGTLPLNYTLGRRINSLGMSALQCMPVAPVTLSCLNGLEPWNGPELVFELLCAKMNDDTLEHLKENGCPEKGRSVT